MCTGATSGSGGEVKHAGAGITAASTLPMDRLNGNMDDPIVTKYQSYGEEDLDMLGTPQLADENDTSIVGWTSEEDEILEHCVKFGMTNWNEIMQCIPGKSSVDCRTRWENHLDPGPKQKGRWLESEDIILIKSQAEYGNRWTLISELLPGRSENAVKNRWKSAYIQKQVNQNPSEQSKKSTTNEVNASDIGSTASVQHIITKVDSGSRITIVGKPFLPSSNGDSVGLAASDPAPKRQKTTDEARKQRSRNRPSRSKAAIAQRERQKAAEKERDEEAIKALFNKEATFSEREKMLIRRSYALGFTKGIKGHRKKGNQKVKPSVEMSQKVSPPIARKQTLWSDVVQWEFHDPDLTSIGCLPLELEHTLGEHGIEIDFPAIPPDEMQEQSMEERAEVSLTVS